MQPSNVIKQTVKSWLGFTNDATEGETEVKETVFHCVKPHCMCFQTRNRSTTICGTATLHLILLTTVLLR